MAVAPGGVAAYVITVKNHGPLTVHSVVLSVSAQPVLHDGVYSTSDGTYDPVTGDWKQLSLPPDGSVTLTVSGTVDPAVPVGVTMTATVRPTTGLTDSNVTNDQATVSDPVSRQTDLGVTVDHAEMAVAPGGVAAYVITVKNHGPLTVHSVVLSVSAQPVLHDGVYSTSDGTYDPVTGDWKQLSLPPDGSVTLTVSGTVDPAVPVGVTMTATVRPTSGLTDSNVTNDQATVVIASR